MYEKEDNIWGECTSILESEHMALQGNSGRIDKICPKQGVLIYRKLIKKLTDFCHFGQITVNSDILCQLSIILDNFLSIFL